MNIVVGGIILLILCLLFAAGAAYLVYQADLSVYEKDFPKDKQKKQQKQQK